MRDDFQPQGWMFINFIALILQYRIYALLKSHDMLRKYSPGDAIEDIWDSQEIQNSHCGIGNTYYIKWHELEFNIRDIILAMRQFWLVNYLMR